MENYNHSYTNQNTLPISKESLELILKKIVVDKKTTDLSFRILSYICLHLNDNEVINDSVSQNLNICNRSTIAKCWKNLIDSGWLVRYPKINPTTGKTLKGFIYRIPKNKLTYNNSHNVEQNHHNTIIGDYHE